jgi:hypothetical protein
MRREETLVYADDGGEYYWTQYRQGIDVSIWLNEG